MGYTKRQYVFIILLAAVFVLLYILLATGDIILRFIPAVGQFVGIFAVIPDIIYTIIVSIHISKFFEHIIYNSDGLE